MTSFLIGFGLGLTLGGYKSNKFLKYIKVLKNEAFSR